MDLKEWENRYNTALKEQIDLYLKEKGDELYTPNPLQSKEQQLAAYRNNLMQLIHNPVAEEQFAQALTLIRDQMPQTVSKEIWDSVVNDFSGCEANLINYLESDLNKKEAGEEVEEEFLPI